ncbi:MAG: SWIM zinc finger domain-containing protein [Acidimicrobiales bacterium]|nr:SWIM zinc finger domain-containing protein [Acidimicrobiales bacterium]
MQVAYAYAEESSLITHDDESELSLATSGGAADTPFFYSGFLVRPRRIAGLLLSVSRVAGTRFFVPAAMRDAAARAADPVVTSDGSQLRFEAFSACNGVYARADLLPGSIDDGFVATGTTNVDFNPPMRNALSKLRDADPVHLSVGSEQVTVATIDRSVTERRVRIPDRWLRGFAEVQVSQTELVQRCELDRPSTKRFLSTLARTKRLGDWWAVQSARGLDLHADETAGSIRIAGLERLRLLAGHAREATAMRIWTVEGQDAAPAAFEVDLSDCRLTLVLSPAVSRGFSGEGKVLRDVVDEEAVAAADRLRPLVTGRSGLVPAALATQLSSSIDSVERGLNVLASAGAAGFDLATGSYFHRELPFDLDAMALLHPRVRGAAGLGANAVVIVGRKPHELMAVVTGKTATYVVRVSGGSESTCTCPWFEKHGLTRGLCKHRLALDMALEADE